MCTAELLKKPNINKTKTKQKTTQTQKKQNKTTIQP